MRGPCTSTSCWACTRSGQADRSQVMSTMKSDARTHCMLPCTTSLSLQPPAPLRQPRFSPCFWAFFDHQYQSQVSTTAQMSPTLCAQLCGVGRVICVGCTSNVLILRQICMGGQRRRAACMGLQFWIDVGVSGLPVSVIDLHITRDLGSCHGPGTPAIHTSYCMDVPHTCLPSSNMLGSAVCQHDLDVGSFLVVAGCLSMSGHDQAYDKLHEASQHSVSYSGSLMQHAQHDDSNNASGDQTMRMNAVTFPEQGHIHPLFLGATAVAIAALNTGQKLHVSGAGIYTALAGAQGRKLNREKASLTCWPNLECPSHAAAESRLCHLVVASLLVQHLHWLMLLQLLL